MPQPTINVRHTACHHCDITLIGTLHAEYNMHEQIVNTLETHNPQATLLESAPNNQASKHAVGHRAAESYAELTGTPIHVLRGTPHDIFDTLSEEEKRRVARAYEQTNKPNLTEDELDAHVENLKATALQDYIDVISERNQAFALHTMTLIEKHDYTDVAIIAGRDHIPQLETFLSV